MILRYQELSQHAQVFKSMTGLTIELFGDVATDVEPRFVEAEQKRLSRPDRKRELGGGRDQELSICDQILMTVVWLRCYPKQDVLGYLFGVSESSVSRVLNRVLPLLEASGRDTMRMPDPGRKRRRKLDELLADTPELAVIIDSFEQRVQRHAQESGSSRGRVRFVCRCIGQCSWPHRRSEAAQALRLAQAPAQGRWWDWRPSLHRHRQASPRWQWRDTEAQTTPQRAPTGRHPLQQGIC
jgi:Helix-turn-helix of DDE superfamily endonuclease